MNREVEEIDREREIKRQRESAGPAAGCDTAAQTEAGGRARVIKRCR